MHSALSVVRVSGGNAAVVERRFGSETLLVPVCAGVGDLDSVYTLNALGTRIWDAISGPTAVADLATIIAAEYDVDRDEARRDVEAFLDDLASLGLVSLNAERQRAQGT